MAKTNTNPPVMMSALISRLAPIGIRATVKKEHKMYRYRYLRLDSRIFPEVAAARRIRALIAPPDFSAPPILVSARLVKQGRYVRGFAVDALYQQILERYARDGYVAVIFIEVVEREAEAPRL